MSWKQERVSMPMTSAGIIGVSSDLQISGIQIDPRNIIVATALFIILVKVGSVVLGRASV